MRRAALIPLFFMTVATAHEPGPTFQTSDRCLACHNGLASTTGENVSIGQDWRTSLMANSSRDPYWQASVRRETMEHSSARESIEDECAVCHMPIPRYTAMSGGHRVSVSAHLPLKADDREAADGVSCSVCHQIRPDNLGKPDSYNGRFVIGGSDSAGVHPEYGPFDIDPGLMQVMRSSTDGYQPTRGDHIRESQLCATCHTLITQALGPDGAVIGSLPEQVPFQEWQHSEYRDLTSCQSCHMPRVSGDAPIARVLGVGRSALARHEFVAANFVMQRIFGAHRDELAVKAPAGEFAVAAQRTVDYLRSSAAKISISAPRVIQGRLQGAVRIENLGGHKLPTAYPSRRAWLHLSVRDAAHRLIFESGALNPDGSIQGNANDADPNLYEPHYSEIREPDQVQIYESILRNSQGGVTTGLLSAVGYLKDNRLLPYGFEKSTAETEIAVRGEASSDPEFTDRGHLIRYSVAVGTAVGPFEVEAELLYQPVGFRWARNLTSFDAAETRRFTGYFDAAGSSTATLLASATARGQ